MKSAPTQIKKPKSSKLAAAGIVFLISTFFSALPAEEVAIASYPESASEMEIYRHILEKPLASYQDLADMILMYRGEFDQYKTKADRRKRASALGVYNFDGVTDPDTTPVSRGAVSKAVLNNFDLEKGLLFGLTGLEFYAINEAKFQGLMKASYSTWSKISGSQLIGVFSESESVAKERETWGQPVKDIREEFENAPDMSDNRSGTGVENAKTEEKSDTETTGEETTPVKKKKKKKGNN